MSIWGNDDEGQQYSAQIRDELREETRRYCEQSEQRGRVYAACTVFFSWFGRKELPDPDVIDGELE